MIVVSVGATVLAATFVANAFRQAGAATTGRTTTTTTWRIEDFGPSAPNGSDNVILKWNQRLLDTISANPRTTGPTVTARALGVLHTATYDAWAAYDGVAKGTRLGSQLRRPAAERTGSVGDVNKRKAISFAAYKTLNWLFPDAIYHRKSFYDEQMAALGYATDGSDQSTPATVGNTAAQAVIDFRSTDNSNQANGYADTTGYTPKNTWNNVTDPWRWQPLCVPLPPPGATSCAGSEQKALTPQWQHVTPFALAPTRYQVYGPPKNADGTYSTADIERELADSANLDDRKKAQAEYWADGPGSVFPPGHDFIFAGAVSRQRNYSLDVAVKLYFALGNAMMDASIASWYQKYRWDFVRPITAIRHQKKGKQVNSWKGPGQGFGLVDGAQWLPYQATNVVTPGFPEYVSGHSTFSGAGMAILSWMTGGNTFGATVTVRAGSLKIEPGVPATDITFSLPTWSQTGEDAGTSRRLGGIHFYTGDYNGRALGRQVATNVYAKANEYISGRVPG
jgi:hypothetical protein